MKVKVNPDTGDEVIALGSSEIDNSIRLIFVKRTESVHAVANTQAGYISVALGKTVKSKMSPWSSGRMFVSKDFSLSLHEADYQIAVGFLEDRGVNVVEDENS